MKLQDYLHYYIGCKVEKDSEALDYPIIKGIHGDRVMISEYRYKTPHSDGVFTRSEMYQYIGFVKPLLRRLEDMTEEEAIGFLKHAVPSAEYMSHNEHGVIWRSQGSRATAFYNFCSPNGFNHLLKHSFDLFGLIPAGLAIDIKTITP